MNSRNSTKRRGRTIALSAGILGCVSLLLGGQQVIADDDPVKLPVRANPLKSPGAPQGEKAPEPDLGTVPSVSSNARVPMPLDPFMTSKDDIKLLSQARDIAAAACMREIGFTGWVPEMVVSWDPAAAREHEFPEYLEPDKVAVAGYPKASLPAPESLVEEGRTPKRSPTKEELAAYGGQLTRTSKGRRVPSGGCDGQAESKIRAGNAKLPVDVRELAMIARTSSLQDSRYRKAVTAWKTCMSKHGLDYSDPLLASNDLRWTNRNAAAPASDTEKRVAASDARCRQEVRLVGIQRAAQSAYQQRLLDQHRNDLEAAKSVFGNWVKNAKAIKAAGY